MIETPLGLQEKAKIESALKLPLIGSLSQITTPSQNTSKEVVKE